MSRSGAASLAGTAAGLAYFAHAMFQNSQAWPLIWAFGAGLAAVLIAGRAAVRDVGSAVRLGALTSLIAGLVFMVTTPIALFVFGVPEEAARALSGARSVVLLGLAVVAAIAVLPAVAGSALAYTMFGNRS